MRQRLLLSFSIAFSLVFAGTFWWFYSFTTHQVISRLREDMQTTLEAAVAGVDVDELMALYAEGDVNAAGFSHDPRYVNQIQWLETVHQIEPKAWFYTLTVGNSSGNRRSTRMLVQPGEPEVIYLVDLWANYDPDKAAKFLQSDFVSPAVRQVFETGQIVEESAIYSDRWGTWLSAFAPLRDPSGDVVAVLGLDIKAHEVLQIQHAIRNSVLLSFFVTYAALFFLLYVLSGLVTKRLTELTTLSRNIQQGQYSERMADSYPHRFADEVGVLSHAFNVMLKNIQTREQAIREKQQAEQDMRQALKIEKHMNELQSRFISMISHEFRTPLTVIRTSIELLEHYGHLTTPEKQRGYYQRIRMAIATINHLLTDIFMGDQDNASYLEFSPQPLDLVQFCHDIIEDVQLETGPSLTILFTSQGNCNHVRADPKLLRSILVNLLSNAVKYSAADSIIDFGLSCSDTIATFDVRDRGIGIPEDDQAKLFELFYRAKNAGSIRGTGLGLAIVKQCVTRHRGHMTFSSQEGVGTTFRIKIPLTDEPIS